MSKNASFRIRDTTGFIVGADGTETPLATVIAEACQGTGAIMDDFRSEAQGANLSVGFNSTYFPKKGEVTGAERSLLNVRKARAHLAIYEKMVELGVPESSMTFSEGFPGRDGWVGSKRIYFNATSAHAAAGTKMSEMSTLEAEYVEHGGSIDKLLEMSAKLAEKEAVLLGWLRLATKNLKTQAATKVVEDQVHAEVPAADEGDVPDTSQF